MLVFLKDPASWQGNNLQPNQHFCLVCVQPGSFVAHRTLSQHLLVSLLKLQQISD
jgi:hypothetical protein